MVRSEGNMSLKNPVTPLGMDPGTVRLVAQRLNHYATQDPRLQYVQKLIYLGPLPSPGPNNGKFLHKRVA
jgi:hypothetical protein